MKTDNPTSCLTQLIRLLNIPITRNSIYEELQKHPDTSSLLAFSDVLSYFGIPNAAYQVNSKELAAIPSPFIAHLSGGSGEFVVVKSIAEEQVCFSNEKWFNRKLPLAEFSKVYTGNILLAEPSPGAGEPHYPQKRRKELVEALRLPLVMAGFILLTFVYFFQSASFSEPVGWQMALLLSAKAAGLFVSVLLLMQSIDANNPLIQRLCTGIKHSNCNAILSSKAAKLTAELSWSEIGFFYFAGTGLFLLFNATSTASLQVLALLNLLSLPYTLYSVYYQFRVAQQWCVLCCTVQALLWLEFTSLFFFLTQPWHLPSSGKSVALLACMLAPILLWVFIKPLLLKAQQVEPLKKQLKGFKYNSGLFQRALSEQPAFDLPDEAHAIVLGNKAAKRIITMVSNPFCPPCSKAHQTLDEWLSKRNDLQLRIVFSTDNNQQEPKNKVVRHLMALNQQNQELIGLALHDWYKQERKDYDTWARLHPVKEEPVIDLSLEKQREWCRMAEVAFTPTILINRHRLPSLYRLEDLEYFI